MNIINFEKYIELVNWFYENDNRECNYQNRVLIPFLEEFYSTHQIVDTSSLTRQWNNRKIEREQFAGNYTPDLLISSNWRLLRPKPYVEYKAIVEIKTPTAKDRIHAEQEIAEYLNKVPFVILTNCITWEFYSKENNSISKKIYSLEKPCPPALVCKRNKKSKIDWDSEGCIPNSV